jgi:CBS domain-containing protein
MNVQDIMTPHPRTASPRTTLAEASQQLWNGDCGILPVIDEGALVGVVTDRDMYVALGTRDARVRGPRHSRRTRVADRGWRRRHAYRVDLCTDR